MKLKQLVVHAVVFLFPTKKTWEITNKMETLKRGVVKTLTRKIKLEMWGLGGKKLK